MADRRISELPEKDIPAADDVLSGVDSATGTNAKFPISALATASQLAALVARVTALESGGTPGTHTRYFGWSDDQVIAPADFAAAATSSTNMGNLPARSANGYIWFAVPETEGYPTSIMVSGFPQDIVNYPQQAGTVDDSNGEPHLVGVSSRIQFSGLAGEAIEVVY